jgi:hypothetical protein
MDVEISTAADRIKENVEISARAAREGLQAERSGAA